MTLYIDNDFYCHTTNQNGIFREVILSKNAEIFFTGKCSTFIEGYQYIPDGESLISPDGQVFRGEMITPWKPYIELAAAQAQYELERLADAENALSILMGGETE